MCEHGSGWGEVRWRSRFQSRYERLCKHLNKRVHLGAGGLYPQSKVSLRLSSEIRHALVYQKTRIPDSSIKHCRPNVFKSGMFHRSRSRVSLLEKLRSSHEKPSLGSPKSGRRQPLLLPRIRYSISRIFGCKLYLLNSDSNKYF